MGPQAKVIDACLRPSDGLARIERVYRFGFPKRSASRNHHVCVTCQVLVRAAFIDEAWLGQLLVSIRDPHGMTRARAQSKVVARMRGVTDRKLLHVFLYLDHTLQAPADPDRAFVRIATDAGESLLFPYPTDEYGTSRLPTEARVLP
jgi:hypothetical protein